MSYVNLNSTTIVLNNSILAHLPRVCNFAKTSRAQALLVWQAKMLSGENPDGEDHM